MAMTEGPGMPPAGAPEPVTGPLSGRPGGVPTAVRRRGRAGLGAWIPGAIIVLLVLLAVLAPLIAPHDPKAADLVNSMRPPVWMDGGTSVNLLGTDLFGRDIFSRIVYGARVSLSVALLVIAIGGGVGTLLGITSGYFGGWVEAVIMRATDIILSLPAILLAIVLAVVYGPSYRNIVLVIAFLIWPIVARQIRGETLAIRRQDYVLYAMTAGVAPWRIMLRHIFPNVLPTLLVVLTLEVGHVILLEATLSFLGAGIPPPEPSWGLMVSEGRGRLSTGWWIALFPGLLILVTVLCFNLLGDWIRDRFDPRLRER